MEVIDQVLDTLKKSSVPMKCGELAEATGIEKTKVEKALKTLKKDDKIISPKVCFYQAV